MNFGSSIETYYLHASSDWLILSSIGARWNIEDNLHYRPVLFKQVLKYL
jgi:hypothetical protein